MGAADLTQPSPRRASHEMSRSLERFIAHDDRPALRIGDRVTTYGELVAASAGLAAHLRPGACVAVWAEPRMETCVAVTAALWAGAVVVPLNPKLGHGELAHVCADSDPELVLKAPDACLPAMLAGRRVLDVPSGQPEPPAARQLPPVSDGAPAFILYTSGTTGPPKGVILSRGAVVCNLDALADAWSWTRDDVLVQALPLFHAHGLILGIVGPLLRGAAVHHLGRFEPAAVGRAIDAGASMLFAVPTMYRRLADACEEDIGLARALGAARILVSGSAPLAAREHARIERLTGQRIVERYGLTETLMVCAVRSDGDRRAGYVGRVLAGVDIRLLDDNGQLVTARDDRTIGEIAVRSPSLFDGYLGQPEATASVLRDGWFRTGDVATMAPDGYVRILGRRSTDLIKTGGYRVGAGEVESALLEHPAVVEAAVVGRADDDLGERIAAWVVVREGATVSEDELIDHVRQLLSAHKRPREVHMVAGLPRNAMGKIQKTQL